MSASRTLRRKLVRDLRASWAQSAAIAAVLACGVATFVMSLSMMQSLHMTIAEYYHEHRFGHLFAQVTRAPLHIADSIAEIDGVAQVEARVVERVTIDMPDMVEPVNGSIVSLDTRDEFGLHALHLRAGRLPEPGRAREAVVNEAFADAHALGLGASVRAVLNGRLQTLRIVGIALSPEFIYLIAPGAVLPEPERFGVFWMERRQVEAAFDMDGAFNDLVVRLAPGAREDAVIDPIDEALDRYGGLGAYGRSDHPSAQFVENEIEELRGMTIFVPVIFLGVAAFLMNIVLGRMVAQQREQIATLKALGYGATTIGSHYLQFMLVVALAGVGAGWLLGAQMGRGLTAMYADFFKFPRFAYSLDASVLLAALAVGVLAASLGVIGALRRAMQLAPAEAMRPLAPVSYHATLLERCGVHRLCGSATRMVLRQIERRPVKTALSSLGVALSGAILVTGAYTEDAINHIIDHQFNRVQRYEVDVVFNEAADSMALRDIAHEPGVLQVEGYRSVAGRLRFGSRSRRIGVLALDEPAGLRSLLDMNGRRVPLPASGLVLSRTLAGLLGADVGDIVRLEVFEGRRPTLELPVSATIDDFTGLTAYMRRSELNRQLMEEDVVTGAFLRVDDQLATALYGSLREAPAVAAVNVTSSTRESFETTVGESLLMMRSFVVGFAVVIAFGVIYNSARISLSERSRDLATMRVIGFTRREVATVQLGDLAFITLVGAPFGLLIGTGLAWLVSRASASELFRIPFVIEPSTYAMSLVVVFAASLLSGSIIQRRVGRLVIISVLKARE